MLSTFRSFCKDLEHSRSFYKVLSKCYRFENSMNALSMRHAYANQDKWSCKLWAHWTSQILQGNRSKHISGTQTPMNKSVRLSICLLSDEIKLQNQSKATEGATELKKEEKWIQEDRHHPTFKVLTTT